MNVHFLLEDHRDSNRKKEKGKEEKREEAAPVYRQQ